MLYSYLKKEENERKTAIDKKARGLKAKKSSKSSKIRPSQNKTALVLSSIFIPPIGLILIFKNKKLPNRKNWLFYVIIWTIIWTIGIVGSATNPQSFQDSTQTSGQDDKVVVEAECVFKSDCKKLLNYGDEDILKILGNIGIKEIENISDKYDGDTKINVTVSGDENWKVRNLVVEYDGDKVVKVRGGWYNKIIYYSKDTNEMIFEYPALAEIERQDIELKEMMDNVIAEDDIWITLRTLTEKNVKDNLKAPKTAKFSSWKEGTNADYPGIRFITGNVSSENSFGAMITSGFIAGYRDGGNGNWELVYLVLENTVIVDNR